MAGWQCPFCGQHATIIDNNFSSSEHSFSNNNAYGSLCVVTSVVVCPNADCKQFTLTASLYNVVRGVHGVLKRDSKLSSWQLVPSSTAKVFPDYIPTAIVKDYQEACSILNLSPKASALCRRCLQGIIRDFWGIKKNRLVDEIDAIKDKVDPTIWLAIQAVREIGNIGAHMEKDINIIVDVEPEEAQLLVGLIEMLIKDWYILRHDRQEQLNAVIQLSSDKRNAKASTGPTAVAEAPPTSGAVR